MKQTFNDDELIDLVPAKPMQEAATTVTTPAPTVQSTQPAPAPAQAPPPPPPPPAQPAQAPQPQPAAAPPANRIEPDDIDIPHQQHQQQGGSSKAAASKDEDFIGEEVEWGDSEVMKRGDGLERIRPEKKSDKVIRLALLSFLGKPHGCRTHFVATREGKRQYVCIGKTEGVPPRTVFMPGICCKQLDEEGRYHLINLALQYTNTNTFPDGTPVLDQRNGNYGSKQRPYDGPIEFKIGFVDLSRPNFRSITNLIEEGGSIYDYDLVMVLNVNKYEFHIKSRTPRWRSTPELIKAVEEACQPFIQDGGRKLYRRLGKRMSPLEWKALLSGLATGAAEANLDAVDDL